MSKDDFITLPTGIDFRKPGQMAPWDLKADREMRQGDFHRNFANAMLNQQQAHLGGWLPMNTPQMGGILSGLRQYASPQNEWLRRGGFQ